MIITPEKVSVTELTKPGEPRGVRITLSVCGCCKHDRLTLVTKRALEIASQLGITLEQLECYAVTAMFTGQPQVIACYKQRDVAEAKLARIEAQTPFISRSRHSFELLSDE